MPNKDTHIFIIISMRTSVDYQLFTGHYFSVWKGTVYSGLLKLHLIFLFVSVSF